MVATTICCGGSNLAAHKTLAPKSKLGPSIKRAAVFLLLFCSSVAAQAQLPPSETLSGQQYQLAGLGFGIVTRPGEGGLQYQMRIALPGGPGWTDRFVPIADDIFEELLGPLGTMQGFHSAKISFGSLHDDGRITWPNRPLEVVYLHQGDGVWRRTSHGSIPVGEMGTSHLEASEEIQLSNGIVLTTHPISDTLNFEGRIRILKVRYEASTPGTDYGAVINNSLLYWRTILEPTMNDPAITSISIMARDEARRERFHFRCGLAVNLRRLEDGSWPDTAGMPIELEVGPSGGIRSVESEAGEYFSVGNGCSF